MSMFYRDARRMLDKRLTESEHKNRPLVSLYDCYYKNIASHRCSGLIDKWMLFETACEISSGSESYAILWTQLNESKDERNIEFGTRLYAYRFRFAEVIDTYDDGSVYAGPIRVGIERLPETQFLSAERLDVVLYDKKMNVLAKIAPNDWGAGNIRQRIGDLANDALLFCDRSGQHSAVHLYMVASWSSETDPAEFHPVFYEPKKRLASTLYRYCYVSGVIAQEALSDLSVGERFDAVPVECSGGVGLARIGRSYPFATLPREFSDALSHLVATGYEDVRLLCVHRGIVPQRDGSEQSIVEVRAEYGAAAMENLARFRYWSRLDVRLGGDYETLILDKVEKPYDVPFGIVTVEYVAVPIPHRKNPLIELKVNDMLVDSAKYGDGSKYSDFKKHVGLRSLWAKLHYDDDDTPYLNIIWKLRRDDE